MERPEDIILQTLLDSLELLKKFSCPHCNNEIIGWEDPSHDELEEIADILREGEPVELTYDHAECSISPEPFVVRLLFKDEKLVIQFPGQKSPPAPPEEIHQQKVLCQCPHCNDPVEVTFSDKESAGRIFHEGGCEGEICFQQRGDFLIVKGGPLPDPNIPASIKDSLQFIACPKCGARAEFPFRSLFLQDELRYDQAEIPLGAGVLLFIHLGNQCQGVDRRVLIFRPGEVRNLPLLRHEPFPTEQPPRRVTMGLRRVSATPNPVPLPSTLPPVTSPPVPSAPVSVPLTPAHPQPVAVKVLAPPSQPPQPVPAPPPIQTSVPSPASMPQPLQCQPVSISHILQGYVQPPEFRGRGIPVPPPPAHLVNLGKPQQQRRDTRRALLAFFGSLCLAAAGTFVWWMKKADTEIETVNCRIERTGIKELAYTPHCENVDSARLEDIRIAFGQTVRGILIVSKRQEDRERTEYHGEIQYHAEGSDIRRPYRVKKK